MYWIVIFTVYCEDPLKLNHDSAQSLAWSDCIGNRGGLWACTATEKTGSGFYPRTVGAGSRCATELRQPDREGRQSTHHCSLIQASECVEVQPVHADPPGGGRVGVVIGSVKLPAIN